MGEATKDEEEAVALATVYFTAPYSGKVRSERTLGTPEQVRERWDRRRGELLEVKEGWHGAS